jgi:anti-sigma B factor antagonist
MEFKLEHFGDILLARICTDSLAYYNIDTFKAFMSELIVPGKKIILDMSELKFIDSSGIGALVKFSKEVTAANGIFKLCGITTSVRNLLEVVRVDRFFDIFDSCGDAAQSFYRINH